MQAFGSFASFSQFYLYGRRHCTRTGYEKARAALLKGLKGGKDPLDSANLTEKTYLVTGANSGVGKEVSQYLAKQGATVHMICRSAKRGEDARASIVENTGNDKVVLHVCDVSLAADVRKMWTAVAESTARLDGLVCNAGVLLNEKTLTPEGFETTFACHLLVGTYLLTSLAMPMLQSTAGARVVVVSSGGMYNTKWPEWKVATAEEGKYSGNLAYAYAKRGQVLLCERWSAMYPSVKFVSCHPGWTQTPAVDAAYDAKTKAYLEPLRSPWEGAEGIAWLCAAPAEELEAGAFYLDRKVEPKHLAGPFFSEGSYTKNTVDEVDEMMARLDACARGKVDGAIDDAEVAGAVARKTPLRERADPISIERFMGKWYVNAAIPTLFDRGVVNSTEEYTWNAAKKRIDVSFKMQASFAAPVKEILQRASIVNGEASPGAPEGVNTRWALSPAVGGLFLPLGLAYLVVDCAEDYSSTIIGVPNRSALYVMTRTPTPSDAVLERLLDTCRRTGHDMSKVVRVQHGASSQPAAGALPGGDSTESASAAAAEPAPAGIPVPRALLGRPFDGPARLCMATMTPSHNSSNAKRLMDIISEESLAAASSSSSPPKYATWFATFPRGSSSPYYAWVEDLKKELPDEQRATYSSRVGWSAPFVWVERPDGTRTAIGGRDALCEWASREFADCPAIVKAASASLRYVDAFSYSSKPGTAAAPVYLTAPEVTLTPPAGEKM